MISAKQELPAGPSSRTKCHPQRQHRKPIRWQKQDDTSGDLGPVERGSRPAPRRVVPTLFPPITASRRLRLRRLNRLRYGQFIQCVGWRSMICSISPAHCRTRSCRRSASFRTLAPFFRMHGYLHRCGYSSVGRVRRGAAKSADHCAGRRADDSWPTTWLASLHHPSMFSNCMTLLRPIEPARRQCAPSRT